MSGAVVHEIPRKMGQSSSWISVPLLLVPSFSKSDDARSSTSRSIFSFRTAFRKGSSDSDSVKTLLPNIEEERQYGDLRFRIKGLKEQLSDANKKIFENEGLIQRLMGTQRDPDIDSQFSKMKDELLESRAQSRLMELEAVRLKAEKQETEVELQKTREQNLRLEQELASQQLSTERVCQQIVGLLERVQKSSEGEDCSLQEKEHLQKNNQELRDQIASWKCRYSKVKTQLRHFRANSSFFTQSMMQNLKTEDSPFLSPTGQIDDINVTLFQMAIDEILVTARGLHPSEVLDSIKGVVSAVHALNKNLDAAILTDNSDRLAKLRSRMSATANNLTTAAKNYVTASGLSPVSLLDAAASHLTATVIEIIKIVLIRATTTLTPNQDISSDEEEEIGSSPKGCPFELPIKPPVSVRSINSLSNNALLRSRSLDSRRTHSTKPKNQAHVALDRTVSLRCTRSQNTIDSRLASINLRPKASRELRTFLVLQTFSIVDITKKLVLQIRGDTVIRELLTYMSGTAHLVSGVVEKACVITNGDNSLSQSFKSVNGEKVVDRLANLGRHLEMMKHSADEFGDDVVDQLYKQELAGVVSDIMKMIKELGRLVNGLEFEK
ncbi:hypothetical protein NEOLI_001257 [Neolecta irregularis DAH-3]|uniref:C3G9 VBS-like domain-containing protein n=1 Tax=Neolecta irregularis (strain DAH-3) TaxID=1198029 RepID=A0A1U7LLK6_NEOID|nr:hypothetical protein NEOLI_001257 [Neolecta irregularis DAH-3]|eukprot:OLL23518.1 hypothetical protein NEOLI_001257 [Neolecta irregularis DAH-3]